MLAVLAAPVPPASVSGRAAWDCFGQTPAADRASPIFVIAGAFATSKVDLGSMAVAVGVGVAWAFFAGDVMPVVLFFALILPSFFRQFSNPLVRHTQRAIAEPAALGARQKGGNPLACCLAPPTVIPCRQPVAPPITGPERWPSSRRFIAGEQFHHSLHSRLFSRGQPAVLLNQPTFFWNQPGWHGECGYSSNQMAQTAFHPIIEETLCLPLPTSPKSTSTS